MSEESTDLPPPKSQQVKKRSIKRRMVDVFNPFSDWGMKKKKTADQRRLEA